MSSLRKLFGDYRSLTGAIGRMTKKNSVLWFCSSVKEENQTEVKDKKLSKAMRAYLERATKYNEFMKKERDSYEIGKRHLANMMGCDAETFSQEQIDEAIEYLFPSGLFEKKARPFLKPPHLVYPPKKDAEFDETGRPYHFLFYTGKPNFYSILHEGYRHLKTLNDMESGKKLVAKLTDVFEPLDLTGSKWLELKELEERVVEPISRNEYANFVNIMERLSSHKRAFAVKDFIMKNRRPLMDKQMTFEPSEPLIDTDGRKYVLTRECPRKTARADVKVISPGTGLISINGMNIEYFRSMQARKQILFPLDLTGLRDSVDIEATVKGGGETGQAGAIRWGISWGLRCFVSPDMFETMRLAGLLQRDYRRPERKKPGQAGARRKFTWKKR